MVVVPLISRVVFRDIVCTLKCHTGSFTQAFVSHSSATLNKESVPSYSSQIYRENMCTCLIF